MTSILLNSRSNNKIKQLRALQQRKARQTERKFCVEGSGLIAEALKAGFEIIQLFCRDDAEDVALAAPESFLLPAELMEYVSTLSSPPDAIAVFGLRPVSEDTRRASAWLLADRLQDPGNFGALLRLADAMNWRGVLAYGSCPDPFSPKVLRGSMGSALRVPARAIKLEELADWQQQGWQLVGTAADAPVSSLNCQLPPQCLLALGHEGQGLDPALLESCNQTVAIPIRAGVDSLNVATAAAMLMHEYARQAAALPQVLQPARADRPSQAETAAKGVSECP